MIGVEHLNHISIDPFRRKRESCWKLGFKLQIETRALRKRILLEIVRRGENKKKTMREEREGPRPGLDNGRVDLGEKIKFRV